MGNLIAKLRLQLNLTQSALAQLVNTNQSTISRIERTNHKANYQLVFKILLALEMRSFNQKHLAKNLVNRNAVEFLMHLMVNLKISKDISVSPVMVAEKMINFYDSNA